MGVEERVEQWRSTFRLLLGQESLGGFFGYLHENRLLLSEPEAAVFCSVAAIEAFQYSMELQRAGVALLPDSRAAWPFFRKAQDYADASKLALAELQPVIGTYEVAHQAKLRMSDN